MNDSNVLKAIIDGVIEDVEKDLYQLPNYVSRLKMHLNCVELINL